MARPRTGQGSPTPLNPSVVTTDVPDTAAPERIVTLSRQGISIRLPELFWQRLVLFGIGVCCYAGGYILLDIALGGFDGDDDDDE